MSVHRRFRDVDAFSRGTFLHIAQWWQSAQRWALCTLLGILGCEPSHLISVMPTSALTQRSPANAAQKLRIVVETSSVRLPLVVHGSNIYLTDIDQALEASIANAVQPTKNDLSVRNAHSYVLVVEIIEAHADFSAGLLTVRLVTRVTLREKLGNTYVAQTHAHASDSAAVVPAHGSDVALKCIDSMGSQLSGWLSGMALN